MLLPEVETSSSLESMISSYFDDPKLFPVLGLDVTDLAPHAIVQEVLPESPASLTIDTMVDREIPVYPRLQPFQFPARSDFDSSAGSFESFHFPAHANFEFAIATAPENVQVSKAERQVSAGRPRRRTLSRKVSTFFDFLLGSTAPSRTENGLELERNSLTAIHDPWEQHFAELTRTEGHAPDSAAKRSKSPKRHQRKITAEKDGLPSGAEHKYSTCYSYTCAHWKDVPGHKADGPNCDSFSTSSKAKGRVLRKSQSFSNFFHHPKKQKSVTDYDFVERVIEAPATTTFHQASTAQPVQHARQKSLDAHPAGKHPSSAPSRPRSSSLFSHKRKSGLSESRASAINEVPDVPRIPQHFLKPSSMTLQCATERKPVIVEQAAPRITSYLVQSTDLYDFSLTSPATATSAGSEPMEYLLTSDNCAIANKVAPFAGLPAHTPYIHQSFRALSGGPQAV